MNNTTLKYKQPKAFYSLFFVEMWERFGYYGLQALLVLYLIKIFNFDDSAAYGTFAAFAALTYATPILGGYIGDKLLGYQRTLLIGAILLMVGYSLLAIPETILGPRLTEPFFYLALGVIIAGNGFFKTSPSSLLGRIYGPNDKRVDSGFTLFYMSINIGSFASMILCGYAASIFGWHTGFSLCALGLLLGVLTFLFNQKYVKNVGSLTDLKPVEKKHIFPVIAGTIFVIIIAALMVRFLGLTQWVLLAVGIAALVLYGVLITKGQGLERTRLIACFILTSFAIVFFCLYFQAPQSINLFVDRNVNHTLFGVYVPTPSFQSLNPFWILVLSPFLSKFYNKRAQGPGDFSIPTKFAAGIFINGCGFMVLYIAQYFADANSSVSAWWVVLSFFLQSLGELLVSALGLAMITKLAPQRFIAVMMGTWFLASAAAAYLSGLLAKLACIPHGIIDPQVSLKIYSHVFYKFGWITMSFGIIVFCTIPFLKRLIGDTSFKDIQLQNPTA